MVNEAAKSARCALCDQPRDLTFHHLIPRKLHRRNAFRKNYSREQLNIGIMICRLCHRGLHRSYDEMTLARNFSTIDAIRRDETLSRHIHWSRKQKVKSSDGR